MLHLIFDQYWQTANVEEILACLEAGAEPLVILSHYGDTALDRAAGPNDDLAVTQTPIEGWNPECN